MGELTVTIPSMGHALKIMPNHIFDLRKSKLEWLVLYFGYTRLFITQGLSTHKLISNTVMDSHDLPQVTQDPFPASSTHLKRQSTIHLTLHCIYIAFAFTLRSQLSFMKLDIYIFGCI